MKHHNPSLVGTLTAGLAKRNNESSRSRSRLNTTLRLQCKVFVRSTQLAETEESVDPNPPAPVPVQYAFGERYRITTVFFDPLSAKNGDGKW